MITQNLTLINAARNAVSISILPGFEQSIELDIHVIILKFPHLS